MKKSIILITIIGLLAATGVFAQNAEKNSYRNFGRHHGSAKKQIMNKNSNLGNSWNDILEKRKDLNLTDQQRDKIKELGFEFKTARVDLRANVEKARIQLNRLKLDESAAEEKVMEAIDNLAKSRAALDKARYSFRKDVRSVLSEEQLQKLKELRQTNRGNMGHFGPRFERRLDRDFRIDI